MGEHKEARQINEFFAVCRGVSVTVWMYKHAKWGRKREASP